MQNYRPLIEQMELLKEGHAPSGLNDGIFGATINPEEASIHLIGVSWEATTSYGGGTSLTPEAIIVPSHQLDLVDPLYGFIIEKGICLKQSPEDLIRLNKKTKNLAKRLRNTISLNQPRETILEEINQYSEVVNEWVYNESSNSLNKGKCVGIIGGDHSTPFGLMKALGERFENFGILHIDAHLDCRNAYEDFTWSHASIMYNALTRIPSIKKIAHIGIRDYSLEELNFVKEQGSRAKVFFDRDMAQRTMQGENYATIVKEMINFLPENVYVSFDIDGLQRAFCPSTGTPVPGGLDFQQAIYLLEQVKAQGKKVIGFDLCEVVPCLSGSEWDENVASRVLYKLCGLV